MAKIWIPKQWVNSVSAGARVFVGGKGGGKGSYETIAAGQTKRVLKSNGRGSVFYENLTIPAPEQPTYSSDITGVSISEASLYFFVPSSSTSGRYAYTYYYTPETNYTTGAIVGFDHGAGNDDTQSLKVGSDISVGYFVGNFANLTQAHKITFRYDNNYSVYKVSNGRVDDTRLIFTFEGLYTNIAATRGSVLESRLSRATTVGCYFRKNWE